jgi:CBS domain containing-hemolysin-like protein
MSDPDSQWPFLGAVGAVALASLVWQAIQARRRRRPGAAWPRIAFWLSIASWALLGLLLAERPPGVGWRAFTLRVIPALGLLAAALVRFLRAEVPRVLEQEAREIQGAAPAVGDESGALDADDQRLVQRLISMRRRRAVEIMVPIDRMPHLRIGATVAEALALLPQTPLGRLPLLEADGRRVRGVVDGRDLIGAAFPEAVTEGPPPQKLEELCRPVPTLRETDAVDAVVEALRENGNGFAAVADRRQRLLGFVAWDQVFRALTDQPIEGGER